MNTNILDKIIAKGGVIRPGVYLQTLEEILADQKSWDDSDPSKLLMFNYAYWVTTDDGQKPQGYDNDKQFTIDFPGAPIDFVTARIVETSFDEKRFIDEGYYFYIGASITIEVAGFTGCLQTGNSYVGEDYNCPSNSLGVCGRYGEFLYELDKRGYDSLDDEEVVDDINERCETDLSADKMQEIYEALCEITGDAQHLITDEEQEAQERFDADTRVYVQYVECEPDVGAVAADELITFENSEDAQEYLESVRVGDIAYIISKSKAWSEFPEEF